MSQEQKPKILLVSGIFPPDIGGPASFSWAVGKELAERGFSVSVIAYSSVLRWSGDEEAGFKIIRVWKKMFWLLRHIIFASKILIEARRHDIIFTVSTLNGGIPCFLASKLFKKKFFIKIVGDYAWQVAAEKGRTSLLIDDFQKAEKTGWVGFLYRLQARICKNAHKVIVPSKYIGNLVAGWGVPREKIEVVYNGSNFQPVVLGKEEARKEVGIAGNLLTSVGRLVPWKGFKMLIKIMPKLLEISQFFRLVIVGDGPEKKNLELIVKNMGLEKKVYLVGKKSRQELATFLAASDIFVLNTGYEGFSHQILEAMMAGVPVITTAVGGNREVIKQGENGFMVKYNDEFNLIEAIKTVFKTPELQKRFIENGRKTAEHFNFKKMLDETLRVLTS